MIYVNGSNDFFVWVNSFGKSSVVADHQEWNDTQHGS